MEGKLAVRGRPAEGPQGSKERKERILLDLQRMC